MWVNRPHLSLTGYNQLWYFRGLGVYKSFPRGENYFPSRRLHLWNKGEVFLIFRKPSKENVSSSDWLNPLTKSSPDVEDLKILNKNLYWETDWKDFLTRSRSIAVTDIWVSSDSDYFYEKILIFGEILRRTMTFQLKIKAFPCLIVFLFNLNIVLIFWLHSKKIVNERHEYLISHKRNLQLTFMYNLQVW